MHGHDNGDERLVHMHFECSRLWQARMTFEAIANVMGSIHVFCEDAFYSSQHTGYIEYGIELRGRS